MRHWALTCLAGLMAAAIALAQETKPAGGPTTAASSPGGGATTQTADGGDIAKILKALEAAGDKNKTIRADIVYGIVSADLGDEEVRTGYILYRSSKADAPSYRIHYDRVQQGKGKPLVQVKDYAYDGRTLYIADHANRKLSSGPYKMPPLKLGQTLFPLPFGQKAKDVLERFDVALQPPAKGDPPGCQCLKLVPKAPFRTQVNFVKLRMWIDPKLHLPVRLVMEEDNKNITTVSFDKIEVNRELKDGQFKLAPLLGWTVEPLPKE